MDFYSTTSCTLNKMTKAVKTCYSKSYLGQKSKREMIDTKATSSGQILYQSKLCVLSPYRGTSQHPETLVMFDLLWKYYEKTRNYAAAAKILAKLADRHSTEINLQQRVEYLSR